ncbi:MAG TPA: hypothetical protein V6C72_10270 [Chroococcales cyanobacterium]
MQHALPSVKQDEKYKEQLTELKSRDDIPKEWQNTPIENFIMSHNFGFPLHATGQPELAIATCIEFRYAMQVPRMYAYVMRRAGGRPLGAEFSLGYILAKGVNHLVMIGHNDCGMSKLDQMKDPVINAFTEQGWSRKAAEAYVQRQGVHHAIGHELEALKDEYVRLQQLFPKLEVAPLFVCLYDNQLYLPKWYNEVRQQNGAKAVSVPDELIERLP